MSKDDLENVTLTGFIYLRSDRGGQLVTYLMRLGECMAKRIQSGMLVRNA